MNCAVDTTKIQQDDGTMRGVEIIPEGCQPVSESECSSGYMAPSNFVPTPLHVQRMRRKSLSQVIIVSVRPLDLPWGLPWGLLPTLHLI